MKELMVGEKKFVLQKKNSRQLLKSGIDFSPFSLSSFIDPIDPNLTPEQKVIEEAKRRTLSWARMDTEKKAEQIGMIDKMICACLIEPKLTPETIDEALSDVEYKALTDEVIALCYGGEELKSFR